MAVKTIKATFFVLYIDGKMVGCANDVTLNISRATDEVSCIDSGVYNQYEPGAIDWTVDLSGTSRLYTAPDAATNVGYVDLTDTMLAGTQVVIVAGSRTAGDPVYTGSGFLTSVSQTGGARAVGSYSVSIQGTGPLTKTTNAIV